MLIGQTLEVANQMGFSSRVCYQFLDRSINHLLGLSEQDESVYAVIPLSIHPSIHGVYKDNCEEVVSDSELIQEVPLLTHESYNRSKRVIDYPMLRKMNEASLLETTNSFVKIRNDNRVKPALGMEAMMLPFTERLFFDLASVCRERRSLILIL